MKRIYLAILTLLILSCGSDNSVNTDDPEIVGPLPVHPLNISTEGKGTVSEHIVQQKTDYEYGTIVELTALADTDWIFVGWSGDLSGSENPVQVMVESDMIVTAKFSPFGVRMFGGSSNDWGSTAVQTADGGHLIVGETESNDKDFYGLHKGGLDIFAIKLDAEGKKQWVKTFGGTDYDYANSVVTASDGGYVLTGRTYSNDGDLEGIANNTHDTLFGQLFVLKLNIDGNIQWLKTYGGFTGEWGESITQTLDGGYAIAGGATRSSLRAIVVVKIDVNGNEEWVKYYGLPFDTNMGDWGRGNDIIQTLDGSFVLTGGTFFDSYTSNSDYGEALVVMKVDPLGEIIWHKIFGGSGRDSGRSIIETADGNFLITGISASTDGDLDGLNNGNEDLIAIKVDGDGNLLWVKTYGGIDGEWGNSIIKASEGIYAITGVTGYYTDESDRSFSDILVLSIDSNGNKIWSNTFGSTSSEEGSQIISSPDGGFIITGSTRSTDSDFYSFYDGANIFSIKLDANGNIAPFQE